MNNSKKNILVAVFISSLLIVGTSITPMQSYAGENKKTGDLKSSIKASSEVDKKSAGQHIDQDNFCYRSDDCQQANQAQQIVGKDNEAKGFNDQSKNIQLSATPTATPTPPTPPTPPIACESCFTNAFASAGVELSLTVIVALNAALGGAGDSLASICDITTISGNTLFIQLGLLGFSTAEINALVECLLAAGVTVTRTL